MVNKNGTISLPTGVNSSCPEVTPLVADCLHRRGIWLILEFSNYRGEAFCMRRQRFHFEHLERRDVLSCSSVCISEFLASNQSGLQDAFGESSDWIEIYNPTNQAVDLAGWQLTDDAADVAKWAFPSSATLFAQSYLLVWASGRDTVDGDGRWHTNFKLDAGGEFVGLARPDGTLVSSFGDEFGDYPRQSTDVSYGRNVDGEVRFFLDPSPEAVNGAGTEGFVGDTKFSVDRGFYEDAFELTVTSDTPFATLVITTDGSAPSAQNGFAVAGDSNGVRHTFTVDTTSTVRAMALRDGWQATNVDTQTYLFPDHVILQDETGLPNTWGHAGADYEMDPAIVNDPSYQGVLVDGLLSIPTLSLVTDVDHWFHRSRGIYPQGKGEPVPVSAEWLLPDSTPGFQVDGSVEIQGGSSTNRWKSDKLSMQLKFKREYGDAKLEYPLFGEEAASEFDTLIVDARLNQAWHYGGGASPDSQRDRAQYTRDQFVADLQNALGGQGPHGRWVHVYLNGVYWGIHNLHERPDEHFAAAYYGGAADDYDVIKHNDEVVNGSFSNYRQLLNAVNGNIAAASQYAIVADMLDIDAFIQYMQVNYFVGNTDWAHHNWYASFNRVAEDGRWRFHSWDAEHVLKGLRDDATGRDDAQGPTHIHVRLMRNETYRLKFMDAVQENFFGDGVFTPERATELYQQRAEEVYEAVVPESARWGDNRRRQPYTRDVEWVQERDRLLDGYFPQRTDIVVQQLRNRGYFHAFDAPRFTPSEGMVEAGAGVEILGSGQIFYTMDGTDPVDSATRVAYSGPLEIAMQTTLRVRSRVSGTWSALVEATFLPAGLPGDFTGDGVLDALDVDLLSAAVRSGAISPEWDLNADGSLTMRDLDYWIAELAETRRGDANLDGAVDFADFLIVAASFGQEDAGWEDGNFGLDDSVGFEDFLLLSASFGFRRS